MTEEYVSYRNTRPYPFCPGCSHSTVMDHLNTALVKLQLDPHKVVIVTDIGCSGLSDQYFNTNAFHGLHGRAITYGTGLKLANPDLKVIVIMGDGGCGIGGHHLINAARRNIGLTVLVLNNFNYGMTGGQHSVTTPHGGITSTTRFGNLEHPLNIAGTVAINGATFVARTTSFDGSIPQLIEQAILNDGFSLLDIWELCAAHFVPNNAFNRSQLEESMSKQGFRQGILHQEPRDEYSSVYRRLIAKTTPIAKLEGLKPLFKSDLSRTMRIIIAGAAGQKIASSGSILGAAATLSNLWATKRDDYPVTVMTGHSISEIILSPNDVFYPGIEKPDIFLALAPEGVKACKNQLDNMADNGMIFARKDLLPLRTNAQVFQLDLSKTSRKETALVAVAEMLRQTGIISQEALKEAIRRTQKAQIASGSLRVIDRYYA
jgi:2-oxoglutarate ferredoxin oxidoreductase subunit beta